MRKLKTGNAATISRCWNVCEITVIFLRFFLGELAVILYFKSEAL